MSESITTLELYQGKGLYSICVAMLCVAIVIVGAKEFVSFCVTIYIFLGVILDGCSGFLFLCVSIVI